MEEVFLQYGILGVVVIVLGRVVVLLYKKQEKKAEEQENRQIKTEIELDKLRDRFDQYMSEDREQMLEVIRDNTEALRELTKTG